MIMAPIDRPGILKPLPYKPSPDVQAAFAFMAKDKNGDGSLSLDEFLRSKKGEITQKDVDQFKRYDRNGDGKLSREEYKQGKKWDSAIGPWVRPVVEFWDKLTTVDPRWMLAGVNAESKTK